jgi:hypothetical protein
MEQNDVEQKMHNVAKQFLLSRKIVRKKSAGLTTVRVVQNLTFCFLTVN